MPRRSEKNEVPPADDAQSTTSMAMALPDDDWLSSLRSELAKVQKETIARTGEDLQTRAEMNRRLLQDLWEVHNLFEDISVHLTMEPSQTIFATFTEFPHQWQFKETFDFASVKNFELKDRAPGWLGQALKVWYYTNKEGDPHLRMIYEWCEGETYHRYSGWMRVITQAVLYDEVVDKVSLTQFHHILKDLVTTWYASHLNHDPNHLTNHLRERYPKGTTQTKESFRPA